MKTIFKTVMAVGVGLYFGMVTPTHAQNYLKTKQLPDGLYDTSTFKNQVVNGLKIDDCMPTADEDEKSIFGGQELVGHHHNVCTDKLSKQLLKIMETTKPNFANEYIFTTITVKTIHGNTHFAYVLLDPKNKRVIGLPEIYTTSDNKKPKFSPSPTKTTVCTPPQTKSKHSVRINVPTRDEVIDESYAPNKLQCIAFEKGRFYSPNKEMYMKNFEE